MGFGQDRRTSDRRPDTRREANVLRPKNRSTDPFLNWSNFQAHWIDFGCVKLHMLSLARRGQTDVNQEDVNRFDDVLNFAFAPPRGSLNFCLVPASAFA